MLDEIKTHERVQRKVLRSKTPEGVQQELYGLFLAHYAVRFFMGQAAMEADVDPDRLSFTEGLFQLTEMLDLALILEPEESAEPLARRLRHKIRQVVLPARHLRVNRREVKQVYSKHKPVAGERCLPPNPLSRMSSFLTLSTCLIRWLLFSLRRLLSEMYWALRLPSAEFNLLIGAIFGSINKLYHTDRGYRASGS